MHWFNVQLIFVSSCVYVNVLMMNWRMQHW